MTSSGESCITLVAYCKRCKKTRRHHRNKNGKGGLRSICVMCDKAYSKAYYTKTRNKRRSEYKKYYALNKEKIKPRHKAYREKHKEKYRQYYKENYSRWQNYHLKRNYGISIAVYDSMALSQQHVCAICKHKDKLQVDHDHNTGKVRGLLCGHCNKGLGLFRNSMRYLLDAAEYISKSSSVSDPT